MKGYRSKGQLRKLFTVANFHYQLRFIKLTVILKYRRFGKSSGVVVVTICAKNCQPFKEKSLQRVARSIHPKIRIKYSETVLIHLQIK